MTDYFTIPTPPDADDWLDLRADYWNASYAGSLFGQHPFAPLSTVCVEKLTGVRSPENAAMRRGTAMESYIADEAADRLSMKLLIPEVMYGNGLMLATLDREIEGRDDVHVEIKSTTKWVGGQCPPYWWWQVQAQMACRPEAIYTIIAFLDPRLDIEIMEIYRDEAAIDRLMARANEIMAVLREGRLPEGVELTGDDVSIMWPQDDGEPVSLPHASDVLAAVKEYQDWGETVRYAEKKRKDASDALKRWIEGHTTAMVQGVPLYTFKATKPTTKFDMETFVEEHPKMAKQYTVKVPGYRRLHIRPQGLRDLTGAETEEEIL